MKAVNIKDKDLLNGFVSTIKHSQFLQSFEWGEFEKMNGREIFRVGIEDSNGELRTAATVKWVKLPVYKSYFYITRGPIIKDWDEEVSDLFFDQMRDLAKEHGAIFMRFESEFIMSEMKYPVVSTMGTLPDLTTVINLRETEGEIFSEIHPEAQEKIHAAEGRGLKARYAGWDGFDEFWSQMIVAQNRDFYLPHTRSYYLALIDIVDYVKLYLAEENGKTKAAGIFAFWGDTVTYIAGGAAKGYALSDAPYALVWQVIKEAKKAGYSYFDLFGIDEKRWPAMSKFKKSFSRRIMENPGANDVVYHEQWYGIYQFVRMIRKWF